LLQQVQQAHHLLLVFTTAVPVKEEQVPLEA
jgi:hypothetical protein